MNLTHHEENIFIREILVFGNYVKNLNTGYSFDLVVRMIPTEVVGVAGAVDAQLMWVRSKILSREIQVFITS